MQIFHGLHLPYFLMNHCCPFKDRSLLTQARQCSAYFSAYNKLDFLSLGIDPPLTWQYWFIYAPIQICITWRAMCTQIKHNTNLTRSLHIRVDMRYKPAISISRFACFSEMLLQPEQYMEAVHIAYSGFAFNMLWRWCRLRPMDFSLANYDWGDQ